MSDVRTFLMMGRPGSGKGTQAKLLAEKVGGKVYSSGERCREISANGTYFGNRTKEVVDKGDLMPEWFSVYLFEEVLITLEPKDAIVFEGAGRKPLEVKTFDEVAAWLGRPYVAVYLNADEDTLRARLLKRHEMQGRADDARAAIENRFARFNQDTLRSLEFFRAKGILHEINAEQSIEAVHADIIKALTL